MTGSIMADAFADIAEEVARLDARPKQRDQDWYLGIVDCGCDLGVALDSDDEHETRLQATRLAAYCVRLLMALPGGES